VVVEPQSVTLQTNPASGAILAPYQLVVFSNNLRDL